ncbi:MAG: DUF421 domain-containing protein [Candidatus Fimivivens sp.]
MFISLWRTLVLFLTMSAVLRFMGKRQLGELQPSELATTIMISNIAAIPIENIGTPMINGVLAILLLACLEVLLSVAILKSRKLRGFVLGHPRCVIRDGKLDQKELSDLRWSLDDLTELLRGNGIFDMDEVLFAIVETNGSLSVYPKFKNRPITNEALSIPAPKCESPPIIVINDGELDMQALKYCALDQAWLDKVLKEKSLTQKDIFAMSCDRAADYILIKKEKKQ